MCAIACHQKWTCRTFDYDSNSRRCRLFEGNLNTGSIVTSFVIAYNNSIYVSIPPGNMFRIWSSNTTIPPYSSTCTAQYLVGPMGIGVAGSTGSTSQKLSYPTGIYIDSQHNSL